jgi:hypothetical protein
MKYVECCDSFQISDEKTAAIESWGHKEMSSILADQNKRLRIWAQMRGDWGGGGGGLWGFSFQPIQWVQPAVHMEPK